MKKLFSYLCAVNLFIVSVVYSQDPSDPLEGNVNYNVMGAAGRDGARGSNGHGRGGDGRHATDPTNAQASSGINIELEEVQLEDGRQGFKVCGDIIKPSGSLKEKYQTLSLMMVVLKYYCEVKEALVEMVQLVEVDRRGRLVVVALMLRDTLLVEMVDEVSEEEMLERAQVVLEAEMLGQLVSL